MGLYLDHPKLGDLYKTERLIEHFGARELPRPEFKELWDKSFADIPEGFDLIIIVNNVVFDAALVVTYYQWQTLHEHPRDMDVYKTNTRYALLPTDNTKEILRRTPKELP